MSYEFPRYRMVCGRGASAIYLVLNHLATVAGRPGILLAPANVCYAALYPALYAGWTVQLMDVSPVDGNLVAADVADAIRRYRPNALLAPHMYGQPIAELARIAELCAQGRVTLLEDCASAMGATSTYAVGHMGDYAIYSTGYAKTVDLGYGGLLASNKDDLSWALQDEKRLPLWACGLERTETLFSRMYRVLRSYPDGLLDRAVYEMLPDASKNLFLYRLDAEKKAEVVGALDGLDKIVKYRRELQARCVKLWGSALPHMRAYGYAEGAVPWRFSFFVDSEMRGPLVAACLDAGIPISDWYPSIAPMMGDTASYPCAERMGETILNLPLAEETLTFALPRLIEIVTKLQKGERA